MQSLDSPAMSLATGSLPAGGGRRPAASTSTAPESSASGATSSGGRRGSAGKGSRGPRPRLFKKGECQADGCTVDLSGLPRYNQRNHVCLGHKGAESFLKLGQVVRFCQRCGVSHPLAEYDGLKRSCRRMLALHNSRRRKSEAAPAAAAPQPAAAAPQPASAAPQPGAAQQQAPAAAALLPALESTRLGASGQPQAAPASPTPVLPSPAASVASAGTSDQSGSWLLGSSDSLTDSGPPPSWRGEASRRDEAAPSAGPRDERVCGACDERVCCGADACRACCAGRRALVGGAAAGAGSAGGRGVGGARVADGLGGAAAGEPAGPAERADRPLDQPAAPAAAVATRDAVGGAAGGGRAVSPSATALHELRRSNAALYGLLVQQQLLAAQALLATAGLVLSQRLPAPPAAKPYSCAVAVR